MEAFVGVECLNQSGQIFLRRLLRQRMVNGGEAAFLGHLALGGYVSTARQIVSDDDHSQTGLDADFVLECLRRGFTASITAATCFPFITTAMIEPMRSDAYDPGLAGNTTVQLPLMKVRW